MFKLIIYYVCNLRSEVIITCPFIQEQQNSLIERVQAAEATVCQVKDGAVSLRIDTLCVHGCTLSVCMVELSLSLCVHGCTLYLIVGIMSLKL